MVDSDSVHADLELRCGAKLTDDDGEQILNDHGYPAVCDTTMNGADHATFVRSPGGTDRHGTPLRERFTRDALKFRCPDCGAVKWACPVCSGEDGGPGWFVGESSGDRLACHNCNEREAARQRRGGRK